MPVSLRLPTFVVGPEASGRGYTIRAASGLEQSDQWTSSMPLVLAEWGKRRIERGFAGRFPVAGGAIAMKARYLGEGSRGSVAVAYGVFIANDQLDAVRMVEGQLFDAIPAVSNSDEFGQSRLDFVAEARAIVPEQAEMDGLGLAFRDRHIVTNLDHEAMAFRALASIDPPGCRSRVKGWCTTSLLASRGSFLPIRSCNLLVTDPEEATPADKFLKTSIGDDGVFGGPRVANPPTYELWLKLIAAGQAEIAEFPAKRLVDSWSPDLTDQPVNEIGWRFLQSVSSFGASYSETVAIIAAIARSAGDETGANVVERYLKAVDQHDSKSVPDLIALLSDALDGYPACQSSLANFVLWSGSKPLLTGLPPDDLFGVVQFFESQASKVTQDKRSHALERVVLLEDCLLNLKGGTFRRSEFNRLIRVRKALNGIPAPSSPTYTRHEAHRAFRARKRLAC
ncbi:MAG: hypothetical protein AAF687_00460 [Pseudomonadota bacterium]